jgi:hypothetical protein
MVPARRCSRLPAPDLHDASMSETVRALPEQPRLRRVARADGRIEPLERPAAAIAGAVRVAIPKGAVKDAVSGTWLGHALDPLLTDIPLGSWTSSLRIDLLGGCGAARRRGG